jgi:hypothetical protein
VIGVDKVYDGTTAATLSFIDNRLNGDSLNEVYTATFPSKTVGTGKTVSYNVTGLSGLDGGNYVLTPSSGTTTASISPLTLIVNAVGQDKIYDGTPAATVTLTDNRAAGDTLTETYASATFSDKNAVSLKTVSVSGVSISGPDVSNYTLSTTTASTTADITPRLLTITATGANKLYDATTTAAVTLSDNRLSGDTLATSYTSAAFTDKNASSGKTINVNGVNVTGTDAPNYTFSPTTTATANITARSLTVTASGVNKVYDGTTAATVSFSDNRLSGDTLTESAVTATFASKTVGTGKSISVSGISISGTDAGNYILTNTTASTSANITARPLTVSAAGVNKIYDATTATTVTLSDNRITGDTLTDSYTTAVFTDKNAGINKTVNVSGISVSGIDFSNYSLTSTTATATATISARALTVTATGQAKVYDGTTAAAATLSDNRLPGDTLTTAYASATFLDKNVGTNKTITASGITLSGTDAGNYTPNTTASSTAHITPRTLTASAAGLNKAYHATTAATVTLSDNRVAGDTLSTTYTSASFADKNVGTAKTVSVSGISISGTDAGNYAANTTASTTASITPELSIAGTGSADSITLMQDADLAHIDWFLNPGAPGSLGQLAISDAAGLTIRGNGGTDVISLDNTHGSPLPNTLHLDGTFTINGLSPSNPLANTNLEIGRSTVFISYSSSDPLSLIQGYLKNGYNPGAPGAPWNGTPTASTGVITSIPAALNAAQTTAIGYADSADGIIVGQPANTIELKYTLYGDTTLTGSAGFNDFTRLTQHYNQTTGGT